MSDKGNLRGERSILIDSLKEPVYHHREGMVGGQAGSVTGASHMSGRYSLDITF